MKKQTSPRVQEYKSVEQKIEENVLKPVAERIYNLGQSVYGATASYFRIPTTIRKTINRQILIMRKDSIEYSPLTTLFGSILGDH